MKILYNSNGFCKVLTFQELYSVKILESSKKIVRPKFEMNIQNFVILDLKKSYLVRNCNSIAIKDGILFIFYESEVPNVIKF